MVLQCDDIRLSLYIIEPRQGCSSHAATGFMSRSRHCICSGSCGIFSGIDPFGWFRNTVRGRTEWLRNAWRCRGYGGWDANWSSARLSGSRWRGHGGYFGSISTRKSSLGFVDGERDAWWRCANGVLLERDSGEERGSTALANHIGGCSGRRENNRKQKDLIVTVHADAVTKRWQVMTDGDSYHPGLQKSCGVVFAKIYHVISKQVWLSIFPEEWTNTSTQFIAIVSDS